MARGHHGPASPVSASPPAWAVRIRRTRPDPFAEHWPELEAMLRNAPGLESKTLFEVLTAKYPEQYEPGQLRTLQRRVRAWKALQGPEREVVLGQAHRPGEAIQTDFTDAGELGVTIACEPFPHKLCVSVLPYSDWCWATVCFSESMIAIRKGVQRTLSSSAACPSGTRPTTRPPRRTGSRAPTVDRRSPIRRSGRSTRSTSR